MKRITWIECVLLAAVLSMGGCGDKQKTGSGQVSSFEEPQQQSNGISQADRNACSEETKSLMGAAGGNSDDSGLKPEQETGSYEFGTGAGKSGADKRSGKEADGGGKEAGGSGPEADEDGKEADGSGKVNTGAAGSSTAETKEAAGGKHTGADSGTKDNGQVKPDKLVEDKEISSTIEEETPISADQGENLEGGFSLSHTSCIWDNGRITREASCSDEGQRTYSCTVCGAEKSESIARTGHRYVTETTEPTCSEAGKIKNCCQDCGTVQSENQGAAATGHSMTTQWFGEPPTCTRGGYQTVLCSKCGWVDADACGDVPPLEHETVGTEIQHGNCRDYTVIEFTCSRCGQQVGVDRHKEPDEHEWVWKEDSIWDDAVAGFVTIKVECCARCNARP